MYDRANIELSNKALKMVTDLFPLCRSIAGAQNRQTLEYIKEQVGIEIKSIPSSTNVFDWIVPQEWHIQDAYIKNENGEEVVSFSDNNLHVVNYSQPVKKLMSLAELKKHIFTLEDQPNAIPYVTSYYKKSWGFCMAYNQLKTLPDGKYEVCVDSSFHNGEMVFGEKLISGKKNDEIIFVSYICHPSLAIDNLSSVATLAYFSDIILREPRKYSYRLLLLPETIGSIAWLASKSNSDLQNIRAGLVFSCLGGNAEFSYKCSPKQNAIIDSAVIKILGGEANIIQFDPSTGSDERQFCSPGFDLPIGMISRNYPGTFPEYHTSMDNLNLIKNKDFERNFDLLETLIAELERGKTVLNRVRPQCEPMLGKRGMYHLNSKKKPLGFAREKDLRTAIMWVLHSSNGKNSLEDIVQMSGLAIELVKNAVDLCIENELIFEDQV